MPELSGQDYFVSRGWTPVQAAGIMGNLHGESRLNPRAVGDGGKAYGIAQWHPDRQAMFQQVTGVPITQSTLAQQYGFVDWELRNTEKAAGKALAGTTNLKDATYTFMRKYERPANDSSLGARLAAAGKSLAGKLSGKAIEAGLDYVTGGLYSGAKGITEGLGITGDCNWLCQFKKWLEESAFFKRFALALIGLIIVAAAFYLLKEKVGNEMTIVKA